MVHRTYRNIQHSLNDPIRWIVCRLTLYLSCSIRITINLQTNLSQNYQRAISLFDFWFELCALTSHSPKLSFSLSFFDCASSHLTRRISDGPMYVSRQQQTDILISHGTFLNRHPESVCNPLRQSRDTYTTTSMHPLLAFAHKDTGLTLQKKILRLSGETLCACAAFDRPRLSIVQISLSSTKRHWNLHCISSFFQAFQSEWLLLWNSPIREFFERFHYAQTWKNCTQMVSKSMKWSSKNSVHRTCRTPWKIRQWFMQTLLLLRRRSCFWNFRPWKNWLFILIMANISVGSSRK